MHNCFSHKAIILLLQHVITEEFGSSLSTFYHRSPSIHHNSSVKNVIQYKNTKQRLHQIIIHIEHKKDIVDESKQEDFMFVL